MKNVFIGVDFGTSIVKATAIDIAKNNIYQVSIKYINETERKTPSGWTKAFRKIFKALSKEIGCEFTVESISITGMVPNVALIDEKNKRLIDSILFFDSIAYDIETKLDQELQSDKWANEVLSKFIKIIGEKKPSNYKWFSTHSWLVFFLSGAFVIDSVTAGECGSMVNFETGNWNDLILERYGIEKCSLPKIMAPTDVAGKVSGNFPIKELRGAKVIVGSSDTVATALGAGWNNENNTLLVYYGTFNCAAFLQQGRDYVLHSSKPYNPFNWILSVPRAGDQLLGLAKLITNAKSPSTALKQLDSLAKTSSIGANGLVFLHSENLDKTTVSSEPTGMIRNLKPIHTKNDLARSALEGFAFLLKRSGTTVDPVLNKISKAICAGGGAKSKLWLQIVSDITGITQYYQPEADRGLGSALLALFSTNPDAASQFQNEIFRRNLKIEPNMLLKEEYEELFEKYLSYWL